MNLSNIDKAAIAKAMGADTSKLTGRVLPGNYENEIVLRVKYTAKKGEDYEAKPTGNILCLGVLAEAVRRMGATGDAFLKTFREVAIEAIEGGEKLNDVVCEDRDVLARLADIKKEVVGKLPDAVRSGRTTFHTDVEIVEDADVEVAETVTVAA